MQLFCRKDNVGVRLLDSVAFPVISSQISHEQTLVRTYDKISKVQTFLSRFDAHIP